MWRMNDVQKTLNNSAKTTVINSKIEQTECKKNKYRGRRKKKKKRCDFTCSLSFSYNRMTRKGL